MFGDGCDIVEIFLTRLGQRSTKVFIDVKNSI
jgi:hypothetical protein